MNFLLFIYVLLISNNGIEEKPGSIYGTVLDSTDQKPLSGVVVEVLNTDKKVITDNKGEFNIQLLPPGKYDLLLLHMSEKVIEKPGHPDIVRNKPFKLENVEIKSDERTTLQISLIKHEVYKTLNSKNSSSSDYSVHQYLKIVRPDSTIEYKILVSKPDPNVDYKILESKLNSKSDAVIDVLIPKE